MLTQYGKKKVEEADAQWAALCAKGKILDKTDPEKPGEKIKRPLFFLRS